MLTAKDIRLDWDEPIADTAAVLSRYVNGFRVRTSQHDLLLDLAEHGTVSVIHGLTDQEYPCHALLLATARTGMDCTLIMPKVGK